MRVALIVLLALTLGAYTPPPLRGHVVDTTGSLTAEEVRDLDLTLDAMGNSDGFAMVVLITNLDGLPIEDIAYEAFNTWGVGEKGKDNGVLLVIAPKERRVRIETGKGVGGALPDLKTNDIIRNTIEPYLVEGRLRVAIETAATTIANTLRADDSWKRSATKVDRSSPGRATTPTWAIIAVVFVVGLFLLFGRRRGRGRAAVGGGFWGGGFGGFGGGRSGGGGGGGSGYSGGGGHSGGGGSNESF